MAAMRAQNAALQQQVTALAAQVLRYNPAP